MGRKTILQLLLFVFAASTAFGQTEVFKNVVNNLAYYKQKKDLKYLTNAKKSVDSLIKTHADSANLDKNVYKAVVYSSIVYIDSLNKLNQPADFFPKVCQLVDKLSGNRKIYKYQAELDYSKRCLANAFVRQGFHNMNISDYNNAIVAFKKAKSYAPDFKDLNAYIAYAHNKLGNLLEGAKYYSDLLKTDSTKAEYIEAAANTYIAIGDTSKALQILQRGRRHLPNDKFLLLNEANIYSNRKDYKALEPLLSQLLDENTNSATVNFIAANCYDHLDVFDKAESLYLHAIELNSTTYDPVYNLGLLYFRVGLSKHGDNSKEDIERAEQWLEKANEISPNDTNCLQILRMAYSKTGNPDQVDKINAKLKLLTNQ
jgi:tetratricopeptide (TPR) repeat protein